MESKDLTNTLIRDFYILSLTQMLSKAPAYNNLAESVYLIYFSPFLKINSVNKNNRFDYDDLLNRLKS